MLFGVGLPRIYVEIDTSHILLGVLREKKGSVYCEVFDQQSFCSLEVRRCAIFNTTAVYSFIQQILEKHRFHGAQAVISCPYFADCSEEKKRLATLQVALCVCKAGLKIESLFEERMFFQ